MLDLSEIEPSLVDDRIKGMPGGMVAFGLSNPCTTFNKWQVIPVVDDDFDIVSAIRTFF